MYSVIADLKFRICKVLYRVIIQYKTSLSIKEVSSDLLIENHHFFYKVSGDHPIRKDHIVFKILDDHSMKTTIPVTEYRVITRYFVTNNVSGNLPTEW